MRGQLSLEFAVVFTAMLLIMVATTMPIYESARADAERISKLADAREAANTIVNALNMVYAGGVGSWRTAEYILPRDVLSISFVSSDENRVSVRIVMDFEKDNVIQVDTILPSRSDENRVVVDNKNFGLSPGPHRVKFTYRYSGGVRYIGIKEA